MCKKSVLIVIILFFSLDSLRPTAQTQVVLRNVCTAATLRFPFGCVLCNLLNLTTNTGADYNLWHEIYVQLQYRVLGVPQVTLAIWPSLWWCWGGWFWPCSYFFFDHQVSEAHILQTKLLDPLMFVLASGALFTETQYHPISLQM